MTTTESTTVNDLLQRGIEGRCPNLIFTIRNEKGFNGLIVRYAGLVDLSTLRAIDETCRLYATTTVPVWHGSEN